MQQYQGIYFEKGTMEGCYIVFRHGTNGFTIGTEETEGNDLIIKSNQSIYLWIASAHNGCSHDYYVIEDFDGPIKLRHSGHVYDFGTLRIQLI